MTVTLSTNINNKFEQCTSIDLLSPNIISFYTQRNGGVSKYPYDSFNLGLHVGDDSNDVLKNRQFILDKIIPQARCINWLNQVHSTKVVDVTEDFLKHYGTTPTDADAQVTILPNVALSIMTADCLPVLLSSMDGEVIGAVHCGWRGLEGGILTNTLKIMLQYNGDISSYKVFLGPCIGPKAFEVGEEVKERFLLRNKCNEKFFTPSIQEDKYFADLAGIATLELINMGVKKINIINSRECTYSQSAKFFSYRREKVTGRMASIIMKKS